MAGTRSCRASLICGSSRGRDHVLAARPGSSCLLPLLLFQLLHHSLTVTLPVSAFHFRAGGAPGSPSIETIATPIRPAAGKTRSSSARTGALAALLSKKSQQKKIASSADDAATTSTTGASSGSSQRKVHYLFLVYNHINNQESWRRYFAGDQASGLSLAQQSHSGEEVVAGGAGGSSSSSSITTRTASSSPDGTSAPGAPTSAASSRQKDWHAYVHCKDGYQCQLPPFEATLVEPVPSAYCTDLVSPMIALLRKALENSKSTEDQFAFFSDSTLPIKPKQFVHETLFADPALSAFCMFPISAWARRPMPDPNQGYEVAAKHHQWVTLSHASAVKLVQNYNINAITYQSLLSSFGLVGWVCLDEYYMFNSLYGLLQNQPAADFQQRVLLDRFNAQYADQSPVVPEEPPQQRVSLHDVMYAYHMNHWAFPSNTGCLDEYYIFQSVVGVVRGVTDLQLLAFDQAFDQQKYADRCYTLACWNVPQNPVIPAVQQFLQNRGLIRYDAVTRPGTITHVTTDSLKELRKSAFLFLRKVPDSPKVMDSCETFEQGVSRILYADRVVPSLGLSPTEQLSAQVDPSAAALGGGTVAGAVGGAVEDDATFLTSSDFRNEFYTGEWTDVAHGDTKISSSVGNEPRQIVLKAESVSSKEAIWNGFGLICGTHISLQFHDQILEGDVSNDVIYWANGAQWARNVAVAAGRGASGAGGEQEGQVAGEQQQQNPQEDQRTRNKPAEDNEDKNIADTIGSPEMNKQALTKQEKVEDEQDDKAPEAVANEAVMKFQNEEEEPAHDPTVSGPKPTEAVASLPGALPMQFFGYKRGRGYKQGSRQKLKLAGGGGAVMKTTEKTKRTSTEEPTRGNGHKDKWFSYNLPATSPLAVKSPFFREGEK